MNMMGTSIIGKFLFSAGREVEFHRGRDPDAIERALAHKDSDRVWAAYHREAYWDERFRMNQ